MAEPPAADIESTELVALRRLGCACATPERALPPPPGAPGAPPPARGSLVAACPRFGLVCWADGAVAVLLPQASLLRSVLSLKAANPARRVPAGAPGAAAMRSQRVVAARAASPADAPAAPPSAASPCSPLTSASACPRPAAPTLASQRTGCGCR